MRSSRATALAPRYHLRRMGVITQGRSPVRQFRSLGSVEGDMGNHDSWSDGSSRASLPELIRLPIYGTSWCAFTPTRPVALRVDSPRVEEPFRFPPHPAGSTCGVAHYLANRSTPPSPANPSVRPPLTRPSSSAY